MLLDWAREKILQRREAHKVPEYVDGSPNFTDEFWQPGHLARGMTSELADVLGVPQQRLEVVTFERRQTLALYAVYRDRETGQQYSAEVGRDRATFQPPLPAPRQQD